MRANKVPIIMYVVIALAVVGLISALIVDTAGLITSIFTSLLIGALLFGAIYLFFIKRKRSDELTKYRKAVKQSKRKYNTNTKRTSMPTSLNMSSMKLSNSNRKDAPHLRVIEGNKGKKKNRASL